jgi:FkbM family methyltransferase
LILNPGNPYPFILADAPNFNSGLVAAAASLRKYLGRRLRVVDVGAAIGDTVVLLDYAITQCMESCVCVDGALDNKAFFEKNTEGIQGVSTHFTMLSAKGDEVSSLVRQHAGTAMAAGAERTESQTLDALLARCGLAGNCDLLKIDVDGFDGDVLLGAERTLQQQQPLVIFEWHPHLIQQCGNDHRAPFHALSTAGYRKLLWFGNRGPFSHYSEIPTEEAIDWWRNFLIDKNKPFGPHFDIVALPPRFESLRDPIAKMCVYPG